MTDLQTYGVVCVHVNISYLLFSPAKCMSLAIQLDICNLACPLPGMVLRGHGWSRSGEGTHSFVFSPSRVCVSRHLPGVRFCHRHWPHIWPPLVCGYTPGTLPDPGLLGPGAGWSFTPEFIPKAAKISLSVALIIYLLRVFSPQTSLSPRSSHGTSHPRPRHRGPASVPAWSQHPWAGERFSVDISPGVYLVTISVLLFPEPHTSFLLLFTGIMVPLWAPHQTAAP